MSFENILASDKEHLISQLCQAESPERSVHVIEGECDRLLATYNEETRSERDRYLAKVILQSIRMAAPLVNSNGESAIWEKKGRGESTHAKGLVSKRIQKSHSFVFACLLAILGAIGILVLICEAVVSSTTYSGSIHTILLGIVWLVCLFFGSWLIGRSSSSHSTSEELEIRQTIDPAKIYRTLRGICILADEELRSSDTTLSQSSHEFSSVQSEALTSSQLKLIMDLLEGLYSQDGVFALDRLSELPFYLHQHGIDVIDYTDENSPYFDTIPSKAKMTIRPALLREQEVLGRGLAGVEDS